jgi:hypothetical protein
MWSLYTVEFYSAIMKNEILSFTGRWMKLENILSEVIQLQEKANGHMFSLICARKIQNNASSVYVCIYIHICMYIYICIYTHIYIYIKHVSKSGTVTGDRRKGRKNDKE